MLLEWRTAGTTSKHTAVQHTMEVSRTRIGSAATHYMSRSHVQLNRIFLYTMESEKGVPEANEWPFAKGLNCSLKNKKKEITDHANPEGNGPQRSKERGRRGSTGPPQPEQRRQKHHRDPLVGVQDLGVP